MVRRNFSKILKMDSNEEFVEWTQPLSPVLKSSKNCNKFMKKYKSNERKIGTKLFETEYLSGKENSDVSIKSRPHIPSKTRESNTYMKKDEELANSSKMVYSTFGFKTALGKDLFSEGSSSDYAKKLFADILDPTSSHNRENKYSFLSTNQSGVSPKKLNSEDEEFCGFDIEEYIFSRKIFEIVQKLLDAIYTGVKYTNETNRKESWNEFNMSELNRKRKLEGFVQSDDCEIKHQKILEMNIKTNISQNNQLNNNFYRTSAHNLNNAKQSSQKVVETSSINGLVYSEHQKNQVQSPQENELSQLDQSENSLKLKNLDNNNIQLNTPNIIISATCTLDSRNIEDTSYNTSTFQQNDNILPEVNYANICDASNEKSNQTNLKNLDRNDCNSTSNESKFNCAHRTFENELQFSTASGKKMSISNAALSTARNIFKDTQDANVLQENCTSFEKKNLALALETQNKLENRNPEFEMSNHTTNLRENTNYFSKTNNYLPDSLFPDVPESVSALGFSTASGKEIKIPLNSLAKINHVFKDITDIDDINKINFSNSFSKSSNCNVSTKIADVEIKSSDMQKNEILNISNSEMNKGFSTPVRDISKRKRLGSSISRDGKFSEVALDRVKSLFGDMNFDDLKLPGYLKTTSPKISTPIRSSKTVSIPQFATSYLSTPIQSVRRSNKKDFFLSEFPHEHNCPLLIQKPTTGDLLSWKDELQRQKDILEKKLTLISKKQEALNSQINVSSMHEDKKQPPLNPKKMNKINLKDIRNLEMQSDCLEEINNVILQINPQNAVLIHFNGKWFETATVTTEDGCELIPTQQGFIGLSEIEPAFCCLPDIKKTLIPNGWIRNHYKWIIWKLASYERFFPSTLRGCFTIDNVIKQLKYRYYRELYCAERPALRKIYEMDDSSQKRMVLCISNIFKNGNSIELELTDGWYCIRTLIDEPLCHQVNTKKIRIGSKLITSGAELVNCEGCYPLEMEQAQKVRLKINFNSTRRAAWFAKLGYQKNSMPLLIKVGDAIPSGGVIGVVKVYIMRTYPLIYREKTKNSVVWRNQNAENKMIQEYENRCFKEYEDIIGDRRSTKNADVITMRNVCPLFQMIVIDVFGNKSKPYKCTVWDATEFHTQQLKENQMVLIYNITLRSANELSCNKRTRFEISKGNVQEFINYKRKYVGLASYDTMLKNSNFGFFDTVGFVVEISVGEENQYFWLTDMSKNLLLVQINEGPDSCLLLNRIQEHQPVVVCNLSLKDSFRGYAVATADLNTIVTNYPQNEYLREELEKLKKVDKTELNIFFQEVKMKFNKLLKGNSSICKSHSTTKEGTSNFSRVTSTDIAMSMINIDDFLNDTK